MDLLQRTALVDFLMTVVWPSRTVLTVTTASQSAFTVRGTWDTVHDWPMAWVNGNRVLATLNGASQVTLSVPATLGQQVIVMVSPGSGSGYLPRSGGGAMTGALDFGGNRGKHLAPSVENDDAVRRDEVDQLVLAILGSNYVLKTGDTMAGPLLLSAAAALTNPAAAMRRDMVALLDGSQAFTGAVAGVVPTLAAHLTTKGYVDGKVDAVVAVPRNKEVFATPSPTDYTWTNTTGKAVTVYACLYGGNGGIGSGSGNFGIGGIGGTLLAAILIPISGIITVRVGGVGANGVIIPTFNYGGGGGGGGTLLTTTANHLAAGGGGGGGSATSGNSSSNGGSGGNASPDGRAAAGIGGITEAGGIGGIPGGNGGPGAVSTPSDTAIDYLFSPDPKPSDGNGRVILRW